MQNPAIVLDLEEILAAGIGLGRRPGGQQFPGFSTVAAGYVRKLSRIGIRSNRIALLRLPAMRG